MRAVALKGIIQIGSLDTKISVRTKTATTTNSLGEVTASTNSDTEVWANVQNDDLEKGLESDVNDKQTNIERRIITIRYRTITYTNQIVIGSNEFDIIGIEEVQRRRFLKIRVKRVV